MKDPFRGLGRFVYWGYMVVLALLLGFVVGAALWIPAFGAVAVEWNPWVGLRIDLHIRSLVTVGADAMPPLSTPSRIRFA